MGTRPTRRPRSRAMATARRMDFDGFEQLSHVPLPRPGPRRCGQSGLFRQSSGMSRSLRISPPRIVRVTIRGTSPNSNTAVPNALRVDHHGRAVLALLQAAGVIGTRQGPEAGLLELILECVAEGLTAIRVATTSLVAGVPDIAADEDMVRKSRHIRSHRSLGDVFLSPSLEIPHACRDNGRARCEPLPRRLAFSNSHRQSTSSRFPANSRALILGRMPCRSQCR